MFGAIGAASANLSYSFVTQKALDSGLEEHLRAKNLTRKLLPASEVTGLTKKDMVFNSYCPHIEVDPQTYEVRADGELLTCEPLKVAPMAQRYFLF
jgi:urease subunit alpha